MFAPHHRVLYAAGRGRRAHRDVAAPALLLSEAGGHLTRLDGTPLTYRGSHERTALVGAAGPATYRAVSCWLRP